MEEPPGEALTFAVVHVPPRLGELESTRLPGSASTKEALNVAVPALVLLSVIVNRLAAPGAIMAGLNTLATPGGDRTSSVAIASA